MNHILEENLIERARWNTLTATTARASWRRAVEATTGGLPTWAARQRGGVPTTFDVAAAVALYRAGGLSLRAVGERFGVTAQAVRSHVLKDINQPKTH